MPDPHSPTSPRDLRPQSPAEIEAGPQPWGADLPPCTVPGKRSCQEPWTRGKLKAEGRAAPRAAACTQPRATS